jgi:hypothetical protein
MDQGHSDDKERRVTELRTVTLKYGNDVWITGQVNLQELGNISPYQQPNKTFFVSLLGHCGENATHREREKAHCLH